MKFNTISKRISLILFLITFITLIISFIQYSNHNTRKDLTGYRFNYDKSFPFSINRKFYISGFFQVFKMHYVKLYPELIKKIDNGDEFIIVKFSDYDLNFILFLDKKCFEDKLPNEKILDNFNFNYNNSYNNFNPTVKYNNSYNTYQISTPDFYYIDGKYSDIYDLYNWLVNHENIYFHDIKVNKYLKFDLNLMKSHYENPLKECKSINLHESHIKEKEDIKKYVFFNFKDYFYSNLFFYPLTLLLFSFFMYMELNIKIFRILKKFYKWIING